MSDEQTLQALEVSENTGLRHTNFEEAQFQLGLGRTSLGHRLNRSMRMTAAKPKPAIAGDRLSRGAGPEVGETMGLRHAELDVERVQSHLDHGRACLGEWSTR